MFKTTEELSAYVAEIEASEGYERPQAFGIGIAHKDTNGNMLDAFFPVPNYDCNFTSAAIFAKVLGYRKGTATYTLTETQLNYVLNHFAVFAGDGKVHANIDAIAAICKNFPTSADRAVIVSFIGAKGSDEGTCGVGDIYLRLHLLSYRLVLPNTIGVSPGAIMPKLLNVAWTSEGPIAVGEVNERILAARLRGEPLRVYGVDKLPHMTDYVVPSGVRIADSARVRLGAYVGAGTTVMPSGFINFNAGTRGEAMIEGRVSQGVIVGDKSDLGGAASIQGTMSGGSKVVVEIGERTLIGALAGTGISLGDDCIVAAGVYIMPSNTLDMFNSHGKFMHTISAYELSGQNGLLFKRASDGSLEVHPNMKAVELNPLLHANN